MLRLLPLILLSLTAACSSLSTPAIQVRTEIIINAPSEEVFAVLADFDNYPKWNPYHRNITGKFETGAALRIDILRVDGERVTVPPHMQTIKPNRQISWGGGVKGIFYGEHHFLLEPQGDNVTQLIQYEDFWGLAVPFTHITEATLRQGYTSVNNALKNYVESGGGK